MFCGTGGGRREEPDLSPHLNDCWRKEGGREKVGEGEELLLHSLLVPPHPLLPASSLLSFLFFSLSLSLSLSFSLSLSLSLSPLAIVIVFEVNVNARSEGNMCVYLMKPSIYLSRLSLFYILFNF